jgi:hypothetical protein
MDNRYLDYRFEDFVGVGGEYTLNWLRQLVYLLFFVGFACEVAGNSHGWQEFLEAKAIG